MDPLRQDLLNQLAAIGVVLPKGTKMPNDALEKRLNQALDASQTFTEIMASLPFNPIGLNTWSSSTHSESLIQAVQRGNLIEAMRNFTASTQMASGQSLVKHPKTEDTFMEVRQCMLQFAKHWEDGISTFVLQDEAQESGIILRIIETYVVKNERPVFVVIYKKIKNSPDTTLRKVIGSIFTAQIAAGNMSTTPLERDMLAKLLLLNSKRLSSDYNPERRKNEDSFRLSFLLPLGPISMQDLGKLTNNSGCAVCGDTHKPLRRCADCQSISYCSQECQRGDWKQHKASCRSLKGGHWRPFPFRLTTMPGMYQFIMNRFDSPERMDAKTITGSPNDTDPPPNIHGDKVFIVKLQVAVNTGSGIPNNVFIYDRQKSFQVYLMADDDTNAFRDAASAIQTTGWKGLKMYRWAKRTGDFELSVCFDRAPEKDPQW